MILQKLLQRFRRRVELPQPTVLNVMHVEERGDCLIRAFRAGLQYCGLSTDNPLVMTESDHLRSAAESYGLTFLWKGAKIQEGNHPVLIVYQDDSDATTGEYHAVFASDQAPFTRWSAHSAVGRLG